MDKIIQILAAGLEANNIPKNDPNTVVPAILNFVYFALGIISVIMIIYSGIQYSISSGNMDKINKAKNSIIYSIVGLVVAIAAFAITNFVIGAFK